MSRLYSLLFFFLTLLSLLLFQTANVHAAPPPEFEKTKVVGSLNDPTAIRFAPNGDMYIAEQSGAVKIYKNGVVQPINVITVDTINDHEKGLLGMELDKNFAINGYLYASYTHSDGFARLSRFTVVNDVANPATELIFFKSNQVASIFHNANDIHHGPDGKIWWSVGDNLVTGNSQSLQSIHGKIARFDLDGSSANDNPWHGDADKVDEIYALGLRNPYRFTFLPNGKAVVGDVGGALWEEVNIISSGANYGWPQFEGDCGSCGYANPVFAYPHDGNDSAISALALYTGTTFPPEYQGVLFYGDYARNFIRYLKFDAQYTSVISDNEFDLDAGTIVDMQQGPDGNLYYVDIFGSSIYKIAPSDGNLSPIVNASADPIAGLAPLEVSFSSEGSFDPEEVPLAYLWDFKDGSSSLDANPTHTFTENGEYDVTLTVSDGEKFSTASAKVTVGNQLPTATIETPVVNTKYNAGDEITYSGSATDPEDGTLPPSAFSWKIVFHHAEHVHPYIGPEVGSSSGSFTIGREPSNESNTWYRIELTVTDSGGLTHTTYQDVNPNLVNLTVQTNITGGKFTLNGNLHTSAYTHQEVVGVDHGVNVQSPQTVNGNVYRFRNWSDEGEQTHTYRVPSSDSLLTATLFQALAVPTPWTSTDIGNPPLIGNADYDSENSAFFIDGGGNDIWQQTDQFHYVYQPLNGDGEIVARITSQQPVDDWTKSGIMIKEAATALSPYTMVSVTPANGIVMQYNFTGNAGPRPTYSFPIWLKLKRVGDIFTSYYSSNGTTWTQLGQATVAMGTNATVGMFVTAHTSSALSTTVFDNVSVSTTPSEPLPSPWTNTDIGSPDVPGSASFSNNAFTVNGSGFDIWGTTDQFHYVHRTLTGDGEIKARVTSQTNTDVWAKAGVMIKEAATALSPYAMMAVTPGNGYSFQHSFNSSTSGGPYTFPNAWVKLTRAGNVISGYTSSNGTTWTLVSQATISMNANATVGLFANSHNGSEVSTVTFDNVTVTELPAGFSNTDIGHVVPSPGSTAFNPSTQTFTVIGGGHDIWDTHDDFQFAYKQLSGDGEVIARVTSQTNSHPSAKVGIMIKESTTAFAPYTMIGITPENGIKFQWTFLKQSISGGTYTLPNAWFKLKRVGNVFTAYKSADGTNWTQVGEKTVTMNNNALAGLFVTSHDSGELSTVTFDNVTVTDTPEGPNTAPTASSQSVSTPKDTAKAITLQATDAEGNPLTYTVVSQPTHGTLSGTAPNLTYTPETGYTGSDEFTFKANDGQLDSNIATVSITITGAQGALPSPWQSTDIGHVTPEPGSASYDSTLQLFTVKGGGHDIWDTHDDFHFAYQTLNGDGEIIARITSQTNTHNHAKAGVMIKESTTAFAPYSMIGIKAGFGYTFQWTFLKQSISNGTYTLPNAWVKLTRVGDVVTSYQSSNGTNWTQVGQKTVPMGANALIGLFVASHNSGAISTATFDNVSVTP